MGKQSHTPGQIKACLPGLPGCERLKQGALRWISSVPLYSLGCAHRDRGLPGPESLAMLRPCWFVTCSGRKGHSQWQTFLSLPSLLSLFTSHMQGAEE
jgi:hypothetical protein